MSCRGSGGRAGGGHRRPSARRRCGRADGRRGVPASGRADRRRHPHCSYRFQGATGKSVMVYGQTEVTATVCRARCHSGARSSTKSADVALHRIDGTAPHASYTANGAAGASTATMSRVRRLSTGPRARRSRTGLRGLERVYPFGWLGALLRTPGRGRTRLCPSFARLCASSMRNAQASRYYLPVPLSRPGRGLVRRVAFWAGCARVSAPTWPARRLRSVDQASIAPAQPRRTDRHKAVNTWRRSRPMVPPTGAKGMNLAVSDVAYLARR